MTEELEFNPWTDFATGLREAYDLTIHMAYFSTDAAYMNGEQYLLILVGEDDEGEEAREMFSVGKDWESLDGGKTLTYPGKPQHRLNQNVMYTKFIQSAWEACKKAGSDYLNDKNPFVAETWIGTRWHLATKQASEGFTIRATGEIVAPKFRLMPDEFLGLYEDTIAPQPSAHKGRKATAPPTASAKASAADRRAELLARARGAAVAPPQAEETFDTLDVELLELARNNDFDTFINLALAIDDVINDEARAADVVDNSDNGFYARNHG